MSFTSGTRLGSYEIVEPLGAGGMGEVYRARDTNLGRDVALKTLPERLTNDPERLARFRREAQVLAALNHPHIGSIYGLEEAAGQRFLVLELVDGETLAARLSRGPMPVDEAVAIAREIAEALQSAHDRGIIHRDLKPANIALTAQDRVKVLDFGLAKAIDSNTALDAQLLDSPTITSPAVLTGVGTILGTAAYMSPEQARGRPADKRSDIWAFGCVLFEMLTGRRAFAGGEVSDTLAAVLKSDPAWDGLPPSVPPAIRSLLQGCLEKDYRQRIGDISTASFMLKGTHASPALATADRATARSRTLAALLVLGGAAAGALAVAGLSRHPEAPPAPVTRFGISMPNDGQLTISRRAVAISPDGTSLVFAADDRLNLRSLSEVESRPIPGADPGLAPEFSPDGGSVAFWADGFLKRVPLSGGAPMTICPTAFAPLGIHWSEHGIVFTQPGRGIMRVPATGGTPEVIVPIKPSEGLAQGARLLPDGKTVLFAFTALATTTSNLWEKAEVVVYSLETRERKTLVRGASEARYSSTGHLLYMVEGTMMAVPFDLATQTVAGGALAIVEGVRRSAPTAGYAAQFDLSRSGALVFVPGPARAGQEDVFLHDRQGNITPLKLPRGSYRNPRVSPDGSRLATETSDGQVSMISLYDLAGTSSLRRLTFGGNNRIPIWSGDGKRVAFQSDREGDFAIFWQPVDGGTAERLTRPEQGTLHMPESWLPGGDVLLFSATRGSESTLWAYSVRDRNATRFGEVTSPAFPTNATFSPDGRWVAYQSGDETSGEATYVQPYPATGTKYEIARGGRPMWSSDGRELFFVPGPSQFASVIVRTKPAFQFTAPVQVPRRFGLAPPATPRPYDILRDGRFVIVDSANLAADARSRQLQVVLNWFSELNSRVSAPAR